MCCDAPTSRTGKRRSPHRRLGYTGVAALVETGYAASQASEAMIRRDVMARYGVCWRTATRWIKQACAITLDLREREA